MPAPTLVSATILQHGRVLRTVWNQVVRHSSATPTLSLRSITSSYYFVPGDGLGDGSSTIDWLLSSIVYRGESPTFSAGSIVEDPEDVTPNGNILNGAITNGSYPRRDDDEDDDRRSRGRRR